MAIGLSGHMYGIRQLPVKDRLQFGGPSTLSPGEGTKGQTNGASWGWPGPQTPRPHH